MVLISTEKVAPEDREQPCGWKMAGEWQHGARQLHVASRPFGKAHRVDQAETRDAVRITNREPLCDAASNIVANDARVVDSKLVEQTDHSLGVVANSDGSPQWSIAPA